MSESLTLEQRVRRIEDRAEITELGVLYGFVMDERDNDGIRRIFSHDARLRSADGVFAATGIEEIVEVYQGRFAALGPTNHFSHGHLIRFDDEDPDSAWGVLASHAEVVRDGTPMLVALRYEDRYRRTESGWQITDRLMSYMYYVDVREYPEALGERLRMRAYGDHRPGDWPEVLEGERPGWLKDFLG